jgi:hypothetical protein
MNKKSIVVCIAAIAGCSFVLNLAIANIFLSSKSSSSVSQQLTQEKLKAIGATAPVSPSVPKDTCGDPYDSSASAWYPVFLDDANVSTVKNTLCRDAKDVTRKDTEKKSVQVASFTNYDRALAYAKLVHAAVGQPTVVANASPVSTTISTPNPQTNPPSQEGETPINRQGSLKSRDRGASINVRDDADPRSYARHIGYASDSVKVVSQKTGADGQSWYRVIFNSAAKGWVRSDFVVLNAVRSNLSDTAVSPTPFISAPNEGRTYSSGSRNISPGRSSGTSSYSSSGGSRSVYVHSYTRRDGTYVHSHYRSRGRR